MPGLPAGSWSTWCPRRDLLGDRLDRVEHIGGGADLAGDGLGQVRRQLLLEEHHGDTVGLGCRRHGCERLRARLCVWGDSGDRHLFQVEALGEVLERTVARDDGAALACFEAGSELLAERRHRRRVRRRVGGECLGRIGNHLRELLGERFGDDPHVGRVDPHVGIDIAFEDLTVDLAFCALELGRDGQQLDEIEHIDLDHRFRQLGDRLLDAWLEPAPEVHDDVGLGNLLANLRCELEVVRADSQRGESDDVDLVSTDSAGHFLQRVERRRNGDGVAAGSGRRGRVRRDGAMTTDVAAQRSDHEQRDDQGGRDR